MVPQVVSVINNVIFEMVHDLLKRVEVMLEDYEAKLHLLEKINEIEKIIENKDDIKEEIMKILNR